MTNNYFTKCLRTLTLLVAFVATALHAQAQAKTAYGMLCYDEEQVRIPNSFVSFPLQDKGTFEFKRFFGDATNLVTAGAYADGYYFVARAANIQSPTDGSKLAVPTDLLRYDVDNDEYEVWGDIINSASIIYDMTYDYSTGTLYAISYDKSINKSELLVFDTQHKTGRAIKVGTLDEAYYTLACTYDGQLYGVDRYGNVCKINKEDATAEQLFGTGMVPQYFQTMEFDHDNGTLYWIGNGMTEISGTTYQTDFITKVDLENKRLDLVGKLGSAPQVAGLYIPFSAAKPAAPAAVQNLNVLADAKGALKATVAWTNPSKTYGGEDLANISKVEIYRNHSKKPVKTFTDVKPGQAMTWVDGTMTESRRYTYAVYAYTTNDRDGRGAETKATNFVGHDTPKAPKNLKLTKETNQKVTLSWDIDELGTHEGFVDHSSLTYTVTRMPDNKVIAEKTKATQVTDDDITKALIYSYSVKAVNADAESEATKTEDVVLGPTDNIPANYDFNTCAQSWTMVDADGDKFGWLWSKKEYNENEEDKVRTISHQGSNLKQSDDWLISYYLPFEAGKKYAVTVNSQSFGPNHIDFYLLKDLNYNAPVQELNKMDLAATQQVKSHTFVFTAKETGVFSIALHATSEQNSHLLDLYGLSIKEANNHDLAVVSLNGPARPFVGKPTIYQLVVENQGQQTEWGFNAMLVDADGNELVKKSYAKKKLPFGERAIVDLEWKPTAEMKIYGKITTFQGDDNLDNNISDALTIQPRADYDGSLVPIPTSPTTSGWYAPFCLNTEYGAAQTVYSAKEVGNTDARIDRIAWMYENEGPSIDVKGVNVKVYMANTDLEENTKWIPETDYTLVYEGPLNVPAKKSDELTIALQKPFRYQAGKNLAVLTVSESLENYYNFFWYASYNRGAKKGAYIWYSQGLDITAFDWSKTGYVDNEEVGRAPSIMLYLKTDATGINQPIADMSGAAYELFTVDGVKVGSGFFSAEGTISTANLKSGVYVVKATKNGKSQSMKISVNK